MKKITLLSISLLLLNSGIADAQDHQDWTHNLAVYEVNIRQYTEEGTFEAFEEHLDRLQDLGVGILWLMPVHPIGEENRLGTLGSYYSVKDYYDINPEFGTLDDFENLVKEIHARNMYVLMDWVPNHTAWDHYLTEEHPEWYVTDNNGNFTSPPGTNWSDVIQLDFTQQGLRDYMIDAMKFWVEEYGVDGFRQDAAGFVPLNFWEEANEALKEVRPDIFLLAEDNGPHWHQVGFDMSFGWDLYGFGQGVLINIANGNSNANDLHSYTMGQISDYPDDAYRMYFTSNHDENSWYGTTQELFGNAAELFAVLTHTFHGMPLIYSGQEAGLNKRLQFFEKDFIPWQEHPNEELYQTLLNLKRDNRALWNGENGGTHERITTSNNTSVYTFIREKEEDKVFVALNLTGQQRFVALTGFSQEGHYRNVFSDETAYLDNNSTLTLPEWGYYVFELDEASVSTEREELPFKIALKQNYPNPFNPDTQIHFQLPAQGNVTLTVYDMLGRKVQQLIDDTLPAGSHSVTFEATALSSGVYIYVLQTGDNRLTRSMSLIK